MAPSPLLCSHQLSCCITASDEATPPCTAQAPEDKHLQRSLQTPSPGLAHNEAEGDRCEVGPQSEFNQTKAQLNRSFDALQGSRCHPAKTPHEPPAVYRTHLVQERNRWSGKPSFWRSDEDFSRVERFRKL